MCARFTIRKKHLRDVADALDAEYGPDDAPLYRPRYNVAPTDLAVCDDNEVPPVELAALIGPLRFAPPHLRGDVICPSAVAVGLRLSPLLPNRPRWTLKAPRPT